MEPDNKQQKLLELRKHPSYGMMLNPLLTVLQPTEDMPPLPNPGTTGSLVPGDITTLYNIASYTGFFWDIPNSFSAFTLEELTEFVNLKTQIQPSYFTVYNQALSLYQLLSNEFGPQGALSFLYTPNPLYPPPNWDAVRWYVIQEFLSMFITSGNFRFYGWVNYPGWMGGPYNDPSHLPYRT
ncbi:MAG: hypothetical protein JWP69_1717 [Flaviaesturariibacter sp.]|nr:hypothetical protein [Flaviaesturariibacter sp.]